MPTGRISIWAKPYATSSWTREVLHQSKSPHRIGLSSNLSVKSSSARKQGSSQRPSRPMREIQRSERSPQAVLLPAEEALGERRDEADLDQQADDRLNRRDG